ncbi:RHS repeat protein [Luteimonas sp. YGD11-2]|uniref:RHS repeat protein n=1 Tax=Luteimonas sp. YGD11-2 TaxID=2508168 RepID=UPI00100AD12F|nr:RHS repeat protein [Luteimonas sp. YGD11-2]
MGLNVTLRAARPGFVRLAQTVACFALLGGAATAVAIEPQHEYRKRVESSQSITALTDQLMGDQVSLYNGATEFTVDDIDLAGNNSLPVRLTRRFRIELHPVGQGGSWNANLRGAGDWDIDVPYIAGTFNGTWAADRCSNPQTPHAPGFEPTEFWQGTSVHVPGGADRTMLLRPQGVPVPTGAAAANWTTRERDMFECIPMKGGLAGEGFAMRTSSGLRYEFDVGVTRHQGEMTRTIGIFTSLQARVVRTRNYLLASRIIDRFGNSVSFEYNADGRPTRISANDGRVITLTYAGGLLTSASAHGRTWTYGYSGSWLSSVTLPDGTSWQYARSGTLTPDIPSWDGNSNASCSEQPPEIPAGYALSVTHPSGAVGVFSFSNTRHYRSGVHASACLQRVQHSSGGGDGGYLYYVLNTPNFFDVMSLGTKEIAGPGVAPLVWTYNYGGSYQPLWGSRGSPAAYPCTTCPADKTVTVHQPDGSSVRHRYGFMYALNEGRLLGREVVSSSGSVLRSETVDYLAEANVAQQPFFPRYGTIFNGDDPSTAAVRPEVRRTVVQQGRAFVWQANSFDSFARALSVTKSNDAAGSVARNEVTAYHDNLATWILGQPARLTVNGVVASQTDYDAKAMPTVSREFGRVVQTLTYNSDGTIRTVADGKGNVTTLSSWKRGIPQTIRYPATPEAPSGATQSAAVDDNGWITAVTDENGFATQYAHDAMGRLSRITYPAGDAVAWNATTFTLAKASSAAHGVPAGHWQHTVATGNGRKVTYLDALWRPVLVREYDNANASQTQRFTRQTFDHAGRPTFVSYASADHSESTGTRTQYDALGRVRSVVQDSELGPLTTTTTYLGNADGPYTLVTSPKGQQTRTWFQAFDEPSTALPIAIWHPEDTRTYIARNVFGKPTSIVRQNSSGSTSLTRSYVYDAHQQLCKTVEPETGATIMAYDGAGNLAWSRAGATLTSTSVCNTADIPVVQRTVRGYDARNRVQSLAFPDNLGSTGYSYTADGLLATIAVDNGGADIVSAAYTYNRRRLLTGEAIGVGAHQWGIGYGYNANGHLATLTLPGGETLAQAPNALGQPTRAGAHATGVSYFPNGAVKQFTYGNGVVHTLAQNARGLPDRRRDAIGANAVHDESIDYDGHGNVAAISDGLAGGRGNRTMAYDGLDRLTQTVSPVFGTAAYTYDPLDNLTRVRVGAGPRARDNSYTYNAANQLSLVTNTTTGATVSSFAYDPQGNLSSRSGNPYVFDYGNRLRTAGALETYLYDGHGRRVKATRQGGAAIYSVYGKDGTLRFQRDERAGKTIEYVHLGSTLIAQLEDPIPLSTPTLTVPTYSATGSFGVSWTPAPLASKYQLQERLNAGAWATIHDAAGTTKAVSGKSAGTWGYRVRACSAASCGTWSAVREATVQLPPSGAPSLSVPATGLNGSYTVSWGSVGAAATYQLRERLGSGSWTVHDAAGSSKAFTGKAAGAWGYQVRGCNAAGCGPWSTTGTVTSVHPPAGVPLLTVPAAIHASAYDVTWSTMAGAGRYELQERLGTGAWTTIHNTAGTARSVTGKTTGTWGYRVRACNDAGCGAWSAVQSTVVTRPPTAAPALTAPSSSTSGAYALSWTAVSHATKYQLQERLGAGGWSTIHDGAAATASVAGRGAGTWSYQVRACNAAGCGGWSSAKSVVVTLPPPVPTITENLKRQWYVQGRTEIACNLKWTASVSAQTYELRVAGNGLMMYSGPATQVDGVRSSAAYCAPSHEVRACNSAGCSAWSSPPKPQQLMEFGSPGDPGVPRSIRDTQGEGL